MKKYLRLFVICLLGFVVVGYLYPGFSFQHDLKILLLAGCVYALLSIFVKPLLNLLMLPFNLLTLGFFSFVITLIIFYIVSATIHEFKIVGFHFNGLLIGGFSLPAYELNQLTSALVASFGISWITTCLYWVFK